MSGSKINYGDGTEVKLIESEELCFPVYSSSTSGVARELLELRKGAQGLY